MLASFEESNTDQDIILDSGASRHVTHRIDYLRDLKVVSIVYIEVADGKVISSNTCGTMDLSYQTDAGTVHITAQVMYFPELKKTLLSEGEITNRGNTIVTSNGKKTIYQEDRIIGTATLIDGLFYLDMKPTIYHTESLNSVPQAKPDINLWHRRLGHLGERQLKTLLKNSRGMNFKPDENLEYCDSCLRGKMTRTKVNKSSDTKIRSKHVLSRIHTDLMGPIETRTPGGAKWIMTFIDDFSRFSWIYFLKSKSDTLATITTFVNTVERQYRKQIRSIRSDNGREYIKTKIKQFLAKKGIKQELTIAYTPTMNGVAERNNRTLAERARSMLAESGLHNKYWGEAFATANFLRNRSPSKVLSGRTPFEIINKRKPNLTALRTFGSKCYFKKNKSKKKLQDRGEKAIFVGYSQKNHGYRLLTEKDKIEIQRDVNFDETHRDLVDIPPDHQKKKPNPKKKLDLSFKSPESRTQTVTVSDSESELSDKHDYTSSGEDILDSPESSSEQSKSESESESESEPTKDEVSREIFGEPLEQEPRPQRNRRPTQRYSPSRSNHEWVRSGKPSGHLNLAKTKTIPEPPSTFEEAISDKLWEESILDELQSLMDKGTFEFVKTPSDRKPLPNKWIFKYKTDRHGNITRRKSRLVVKGYAEKFGVDYNEIFASVLKQNSLRLIIALATINEWHIEQLDIKTAFLNGTLREEIYMDLPEGLKDKHQPGTCIKLKKSLYGLKQAPRVWFETLTKVLINMGFEQCKLEPCIFFVKIDDDIFLISVFVDDLLAVCRITEYIQSFKEELKKRFEITDLGPASTYLSFEIDRTKTCTFVSQRKYIKTILKKFNMENCKPVNTPMALGQNLEEPDQVPIDVPYRQAIGSLLYLALSTRPDITFAVVCLSKYTAEPRKIHWNAIKRIFRYLKGTIDLALCYQKDQPFLVGYSDANFATDLDRRSISGYIFKLGGAAISWKSKKQELVTLSTMESEFVALNHAAKEAIWIKNLLCELSLPVKSIESEEPSPVLIYEDNQSCIAASENPKYHQRTKHIDIRYHFIRERIQSGDIILEYMPTNEMTADMLTKPLPFYTFQKHVQNLGLRSVRIRGEC